MITTTHNKSQTTFSAIFQWRSLKTKVTIFTLSIFLIGIWSLAFFAYNILHNEMEQALGEQQYSTVSIIAKEINTGLDDRMKALEKVATLITPAMMANAVALQTLIEGRAVLSMMFNGGFYVNQFDGTAIADVPRSTGRIGMNSSDRTWMIEALNGKSTIGKAIIGKKLQVPVFSIAVPIFNTKGKVIGVLVGVTDLNKPNFISRITDNSYGKTGGFLLVAPEARTIVYATDKKRIMEVLPAPGINKLIDRFIQSHEGSGITIRPSDGAETLSSAKGIPLAGWYVVALMPTEEAFAPIRAMMWRLLLAALFLTLLLGGLTWWMLRRQLSPVFTTIKTLATLADSDQAPHPLLIVRQDEIGELIGGFNHLLSTLGKREEALQKGQELEELILLSVPHGLFGVEYREIIFANDAIKNVSGWEPEELKGKSTRILFRNDQEWEEYGAMLYSMLKTESVISFDPPMPLIKKDGSEIYCRTSASRIGGDLTAGNLIVAMIEDITERKRSEETVYKSEEKFRLIFDASPVGIGIATLDGQVLAANAATIKMMGYTLEEIKTINVRDTYVRPDDRNLILKIVNETGAVSDYEVELKRKDGSSYWALLNMDKIRLDDQDIFLSTHRDITERKQAEKALRKNEEKYRLLFETAGEGILIAHEDKIKFTNPALEEILGYPSDIITTKPFSSFIHPDDRAMVVDHHMRRMRGEPMETGYRFRIIAADGTVRWLHIISRIISWEGIPASLSFVMNITDHKQAEDELRESEERYRNLFENASEAIFVAQDGNLVFLNSRTATQIGYSIEELKSKAFIDFIHPDDQEMVIDNHIKRMKGEEIPNTYTFRFIHRDSSVRWGELNAISINWDGKPATLNFMTDITERKQAEEALKESAARLTRAEKTAKMGNWKLMLNTKEFIGSPGAQTIYGAEGDILSFDDARKCTLPEYIDILNKGLTDLITKDIPYNLDIKICRPTDGKIIDIHSIAEYDKDNNIVYGVIQDITEQKQAEEEKRDLQERLNRAEKMEALGTLAGGVAHDLNNVLGIIVGYSEMILDDVDEKSSLKRPLVNIFNSGQKAAAIVDDLLTLARRGVPVSSILNLNTIIANFQNSPELKNLSFHHPDVKIKTNLDPDLLNISGSSVHLGKSLYNLISNASEAMTKGGTLTIKTTNQYLDKPMSGYNEIREGDYVVLTISDTGEGISEADMKRIFEPFYTKKIMGRSGTGLGLAVVWGTVTDHNGYINVHSEEGKGSTFTLYFPVTREEIPDEALAIDVSAYMGSGQSILIVDDVKEQRDLATDMLSYLNYKVSSVKSGEEAILYLKDHQLDLIVLDMIMDPGMDGLDTYKSIIKMNPQQKTIIVSGFSESDRVKEAKRLGVGAYVRKPYIKEKLGMAVKKELEQK